MKAEALFDKLAVTLLEVERGTLKEKKNDLEAKRVLDRPEENLPGNLPQAGADRH